MYEKTMGLQENYDTKSSAAPKEQWPVQSLKIQITTDSTGHPTSSGIQLLIVIINKK